MKKDLVTEVKIGLLSKEGVRKLNLIVYKSSRLSSDHSYLAQQSSVLQQLGGQAQNHNIMEPGVNIGDGLRMVGSTQV